MKIIWAALRWLTTNTIFGLCLYFGIFKGVNGAQNLTMGFVWFTFIMSMFLWKDEVAISCLKNGAKRVNFKLNLCVDFLAIAVMVWAGWVFMPIPYAISILGIGQLHNPRLIKQAANNAG